MNLEFFKCLFIIVMRQVLKLSYILPMKNNRVIFESFSGEGYSCNPKYISDELYRKYGNKIEIVWALKDVKKGPEYGVICKYRSLKHILYRVTSKVYVCNFLQITEIPKRKKQVEIQTWHGGGCYKKVGKEEKERNAIYNYRRDKHIKETDYFITSSEYWEREVMRNQFGYTGKALSIGMPRNDCLVNEIDDSKYQAIRKSIGLKSDEYFVLYAPTWREGFDEFPKIDEMRIAQAFEERFGKKVVLAFRAHLYGKEKNTSMLDLTNYPDMQELLCVCDALITDYSSSIWDYSLTHKPCFLYVPDLKRYIEQRGFDKDIYTWGFPICLNNEELEYAIYSINLLDIERKMKNHQLELGSFEKGQATSKVVKLIADICK